jgi:hypothetical protein
MKDLPVNLFFVKQLIKKTIYFTFEIVILINDKKNNR